MTDIFTALKAILNGRFKRQPQHKLSLKDGLIAELRIHRQLRNFPEDHHASVSVYQKDGELMPLASGDGHFWQMLYWTRLYRAFNITRKMSGGYSNIPISGNASFKDGAASLARYCEQTLNHAN